MISQLQLLEATILEFKERYHITATELASLKNKLAQDNTTGQLLTLSKNLDSANEEIATLTQKINELTDEKNQLTNKITTLEEQNTQLHNQKCELALKQKLAVERVEVITNWLTKIDNGTI